MKKNFLIIISFFSILFFGSCAKDNFDAPQSDFNGRFVYQGQPVYVQHGNMKAELWQKGYGNYGVIDVNVDQEGMFSSKLFDGSYKFTISNNQVPFLWPGNSSGKPDSLDINVSGNTTMNIEVKPYFMIRNPVISLALGKVNGSCSVEKIITGTDEKIIEYVSLYINKAQFVDGLSTNNIANQRIMAADIPDLNAISLSVDIPAISPAQNYIFARIGIKIAGIENMIFSPLTRLTF